MAWDPVRKRGVLFGGYAGSNRGYELGDTWEWDGTAWRYRATPVAPAPRQSHQMAFDPVRRTVLLFGGTTARYPFTRFGDTWEWDGQSWRQLQPAVSPTPRSGHAMAADPVRGRIVLFGGTGPSNDTWEWDGTTWSPRPSSTLPPRSVGAALAYHAQSGRTVLFGGTTGFSNVPADVWTWDGTDWTRHSPAAGPAARNDHAMAAEPATGHAVVYGGVNDLRNYFNDTWRWDGTAWQDVTPARSPPTRDGPAAFSDGRRVVMFGGFVRGGTQSHATWRWDGSSWGRLHETALPGSSLRAAHVPSRDEILLVESWSSSPAAWTIPGGGHTAVLQPTVAPPVQGVRNAELVHHAGVDKTMYLYGSEVWLHDGTRWTRDPTAPIGFSRGVYDSQAGLAVFFASTGSILWQWDGAAWTSRTIGVGPTAGPVMAYDPSRRRIVAFGGLEFGGQLSDETWEWDGSVWHQRMPVTRPPARFDHHMAYVPALRGVLMFSGEDGRNPLRDTWLWDGTDWRQLMVPPAPGWTPLGLPESSVYDAGRQRLLAFMDLGVTRFGPWAWELRFDALSTPNHYPRPGETLRVDAHLPGEAGHVLVLGLSESNRPGIPLRRRPGVGAELLPLAQGPLLSLSLQVGLVGVLDRQGRARVSVPIPNDPFLRWFPFHAAGITLARAGLASITNDLALEVVR